MEPAHQTIILLHATNHAIKADRALRKARIESKLIPVPRHISSDCGVCIRISPNDREKSVKILAEAHVSIDTICEL